jgi:Nucleotidyl transferase AbiEii toxin, Type IV TA system
MAKGFNPRLEVLPPAQRRLWDALSSVPPGFCLYGGTALALHLGHRISVDFDFFGDTAIDPRLLLSSIPFLSDASVTRLEPNTLECAVDREGPIKLSFFGVPGLRRLSPPLVAPDNGLRVASLLDLAGTKISVVQMRAEAKDYLDIDALLADARIDLPMALAAGLAIYGETFNPQNALKALSYFGDGNLDALPGHLKERLVNAVRAVDLDRLPTISPNKGDAA